ncbi:DNA adenine methylase [Nocardia gipuzkoensis]|uniref:DNA adenine methylase n=1 Tax=Nocardia gipuzkoensis TaxID=2749991 RepID=UPI00237E6796|nr:DNA adenine methylase [Nocardia gipuzkoensis]MDE1672644.1 DNA adenine methylase [Nocardia gipuzkoensis]
MRPPFPYYGGKMRIAAQIANMLPPYRHYVEPFAGSLSVLLAKSATAFETVNDAHSELMTFWRVLRDRPNELARACALTPHKRAEFASAADLAQDDELEVARRVWIRLSQSRSATLRRTGWRYYINPAGSSSSMPGYLAGYVQRLASVAERLHSVSLECRDALEVITSFGRSSEVCLYVDPPYLGSVRTGSSYVHEMRSDAEHELLLEHLLRCRSGVVLSGYASAMYGTALAGWSRVEIPVFNGNSVDGARTEIIWTNREIRQPATLHFEVQTS